MNFIDGEIICIDKPLGWTSFDAVSRVRSAISRRTGIKKIKVGHAGTLDPLATGVIILTTGRYTRRIEELQAGIKEYVATIAIGATTPSFDLETEIDATMAADHVTEDMVREALKRFTGRIEQIPPAYSAIKVGGKRAYEAARKGQTVELKPKVLVIDEIELLDFRPCGQTPGTGADADAGDPASRSVRRRISPLHATLASARIRVLCSKGTYIRALARDIGLALGSGAHLTALRRTRVGDVTEADCMSVQQVADMIARCPVEFPDDLIPHRDPLPAITD